MLASYLRETPWTQGTGDDGQFLLPSIPCVIVGFSEGPREWSMWPVQHSSLLFSPSSLFSSPVYWDHVLSQLLVHKPLQAVLERTQAKSTPQDGHLK
jgi:hypothetical protein